MLFIIDARYSGNNDNPWAFNNYIQLVKDIERWTKKNAHWNVSLLPQIFHYQTYFQNFN
jgi:hypothetical protein